jgi:hypothetical protein
MENQQLDARADAFYGAGLIPELKVLARGLTTFFRLKKIIKLVHMKFIRC